jgi:hypothetical protein
MNKLIRLAALLALLTGFGGIAQANGALGRAAAVTPF